MPTLIWIALTLFLYLNGAVWVLRATNVDPTLDRQGLTGDWFHWIMIILWPLILPLGSIIWLWSVIKPTRTYI